MDKDDAPSAGIGTFLAPEESTDLALEAVTNADIERYATMPLARVNAELREHGIDPTKTIEAVNRLVQASLRRTVKV